MMTFIEYLKFEKKNYRLARTQANSPPAESSKPAQSQQQPKPSSSTSRLQFKLPDGSSTMQEFPNSDSLQSVINFVKANLKLSGDFRLSTAFPRREFTQNDYSQSLLGKYCSPFTKQNLYSFVTLVNLEWETLQMSSTTNSFAIWSLVFILENIDHCQVSQQFIFKLMHSLELL